LLRSHIEVELQLGVELGANARAGSPGNSELSAGGSRRHRRFQSHDDWNYADFPAPGQEPVIGLSTLAFARCRTRAWSPAGPRAGQGVPEPSPPGPLSF